MKSKLLESEERIINNIQAKTIEEKCTISSIGLCTTLTKWQIYQKELPPLNQKAISIESTQEDKSNLPSVCHYHYYKRGIRLSILVPQKKQSDKHIQIYQSQFFLG